MSLTDETSFKSTNQLMQTEVLERFYEFDKIDLVTDSRNFNRYWQILTVAEICLLVFEKDCYHQNLNALDFPTAFFVRSSSTKRVLISVLEPFAKPRRVILPSLFCPSSGDQIINLNPMKDSFLSSGCQCTHSPLKSLLKTPLNCTKISQPFRYYLCPNSCINFDYLYLCRTLLKIQSCTVADVSFFGKNHLCQV